MILVFEHIVGGGMRDQPLEACPEDIRFQAKQMLWTLSCDLAACQPSTPIAVFCDDRLTCPETAQEWIDRDKIKVYWIGQNENIEAHLKTLFPELTQAIIIAPENEAILMAWERLFRKQKIDLYNCDAKTIRLTTDKRELAAFLRAHDIPHPCTWLLKEVMEGAVNLHQDVILKPRDGAGCEYNMTVSPEQLIRSQFEKAFLIRSQRDSWLIQEKVQGKNVSVLLFVSDHQEIEIVGSGLQYVQETRKQEEDWCQSVWSYQGGRWPMPDHLKWLEPIAEDMALSTLRLLLKQGFKAKGLIGIDLVVNENIACVIEINPRLTFSYVGLSKRLGHDVAKGFVGPCPMFKSFEPLQDTVEIHV